MHEGVVVSVGEGQVVEYLVLGADSVGLLSAGRTVIPGEGHCTPTIMVVNRQDETAVKYFNYFRKILQQFLKNISIILEKYFKTFQKNILMLPSL